MSDTEFKKLDSKDVESNDIDYFEILDPYLINLLNKLNHFEEIKLEDYTYLYDCYN